MNRLKCVFRNADAKNSFTYIYIDRCASVNASNGQLVNASNARSCPSAYFAAIDPKPEPPKTSSTTPNAQRRKSGNLSTSELSSKLNGNADTDYWNEFGI